MILQTRIFNSESGTIYTNMRYVNESGRPVFDQVHETPWTIDAEEGILYPRTAVYLPPGANDAILKSPFQTSRFSGQAENMDISEYEILKGFIDSLKETEYNGEGGNVYYIWRDNDCRPAIYVSSKILEIKTDAEDIAGKV